MNKLLVKNTPDTPLALIFREVASRSWHKAGATILSPDVVPNLALGGSTGVPPTMSNAVSGVYVLNEATALSPSWGYYHSTTNMENVLPPGMVVGGKNYGVLEVIAFGMAAGTLLGDGAGLKPLCAHFEASTGLYTSVVPAATSNSSFSLIIPTDKVNASGYYDNAGFVTTDISGVTLTPDANGAVDTITIGDLSNSENDLKQSAVTITWYPFANLGNLTIANGTPYYTAVYWHEQTVQNQLDISLLCSYFSGATLEFKLRINVAGASIGQACKDGIPVCAPRALASKIIARHIYVKNFTADGVDWKAFAKDQGDLFLANNAKQVSTASKTIPGALQVRHNFIPPVDLGYKAANGTDRTWIRGLVDEGREVRLYSTAQAYSVDTTGKTSTLARVDLVLPDDVTVAATQFIKFWGNGVTNYRGGTTNAGAAYDGVVVIKCSLGLAKKYQLQYCTFKVYRADGTLEFKAQVLFNAEFAAAP